MNKHLLRFLLMLLSFAVGVSIALLVRCVSQRQTSPTLLKPALAANDGIGKDRSKEILAALFPNGTWARPTDLQQYERDEVVRALKGAQREAPHLRALGIAFLLAVLGEDYQLNKSKLVEELAGCRTKPHLEDANCRELVSDYLIELGRRGDRSVLGSLFDISHTADGALAESLGDFYSDALDNYPAQFLLALKPYSYIEQWEVCSLAGRVDGGGMSDETIAKLKRTLTHIPATNGSLAHETRRCLVAIKEANSGGP